MAKKKTIELKEDFKKELESEVKTALNAICDIPNSNLTNMIEGNILEDGRLYRTDTDENKADVEWRKALDDAYDIIANFADKYGISTL